MPFVTTTHTSSGGGSGDATTLHGATVPAAGSLTPGQILLVSAAAALVYGALDLANAASVTGVLPSENLAAATTTTRGGVVLTNDFGGTGASPSVLKVNGVAYPVGGALVTGTLPRATGIATVAYGALDLANTNAITGVLPSANLAAATSGAPGAVQLTNNFGGTATAPTVVGLTIPSQAQGDVLYFNGSAWVRLGAGTSGQPLVTGGAGANPGWSTNFGSQTLVTTGSVSAGSTPSAAGTFRMPNAGTITTKNGVGNGDITALTTDSSNGTILGNADGIVWIKSASTIRVQVSGTTYFQVGSASLNSVAPTITFDNGVTPTVQQTTSGSDIATHAFTLTSQAPFPTATGTNRVPGDLILAAPSPTNSGTTRARVVLKNDGSDILVADKSTTGVVRVRFNSPTQSTVGSPGGASPVPANPTAYGQVNWGGTDYVVPLFLPA